MTLGATLHRESLYIRLATSGDHLLWEGREEAKDRDRASMQPADHPRSQVPQCNENR